LAHWHSFVPACWLPPTAGPANSDEYPEGATSIFNPEVALSPARFKMMQEEEFNHHEVHCMPADKENCKNLKLIDLDYTKDLDTHWLQVSLDFLDKMKGSDQPWYLILRWTTSLER
jgi:hypothetical protein